MRRSATSTGRDGIVFSPDGGYRESYTIVMEVSARTPLHGTGTWSLKGDKVAIQCSDGKTPDAQLTLIGLGPDRQGKNLRAYLINEQYVDKFFYEMFRRGADMSTYHSTREAKWRGLVR